MNTTEQQLRNLLGTNVEPGERMPLALTEMLQHMSWSTNWNGVHSGHGGVVEVDHFECVVQGARKASKYVESALHAELVRHDELGFHDFAKDHETFFSHVN